MSVAALHEVNPGLVAVMGLTTVELIKLWQSVAPTLQEARDAQPGNVDVAQRMLDANYLGAGLAFLVGGTTSLLLHSWLPLLMSLGSVTLFSYWFRQVYLSE